MTVVFGLLSAFIQGLAYITVHIVPGTVSPMVYFGVFSFHIHDFTLVMLVSTISGLLGLISSIKRYNELISIGFTGGFLGILGFLFCPSGFFYSLFTGEYGFYILGLGSCLTLISVSLMLIGLTVRSKGWHYITLLGVPLLLISRLSFPMLILSDNRLLFFSIHKSSLMNVLLAFSILIGFALTLLGSAIGAWKFRAGLRQIVWAHRS